MIAAVLLAALLAALAFFSLHRLIFGGDPFEPRLSACRSQPSADCLTDLGVDLALAERRPQGYRRKIDHLAQMGRFDAAHALEMRSKRAQRRRASILACSGSPRWTFSGAIPTA